MDRTVGCHVAKWKVGSITDLHFPFTERFAQPLLLCYERHNGRSPALPRRDSARAANCYGTEEILDIFGPGREQDAAAGNLDEE